jgi:hypothetical protein
MAEEGIATQTAKDPELQLPNVLDCAKELMRMAVDRPGGSEMIMPPTPGRDQARFPPHWVRVGEAYSKIRGFLFVGVPALCRKVPLKVASGSSTQQTPGWRAIRVMSISSVWAQHVDKLTYGTSLGHRKSNTTS